jgi:hypothetical protein
MLTETKFIPLLIQILFLLAQAHNAETEHIVLANTEAVLAQDTAASTNGSKFIEFRTNFLTKTKG